MTSKQEELKKEFVKFYEDSAQADDYVPSFPVILADWWLSKLSSSRAELLKKIVERIPDNAQIFDASPTNMWGVVSGKIFKQQLLNEFREE